MAEHWADAAEIQNKFLEYTQGVQTTQDVTQWNAGFPHLKFAFEFIRNGQDIKEFAYVNNFIYDTIKRLFRHNANDIAVQRLAAFVNLPTAEPSDFIAKFNELPEDERDRLLTPDNAIDENDRIPLLPIDQPEFWKAFSEATSVITQEAYEGEYIKNPQTERAYASRLQDNKAEIDAMCNAIILDLKSMRPDFAREDELRQVLKEVGRSSFCTNLAGAFPVEFDGVDALNNPKYKNTRHWVHEYLNQCFKFANNEPSEVATQRMQDIFGELNLTPDEMGRLGLDERARQIGAKYYEGVTTQTHKAITHEAPEIERTIEQDEDELAAEEAAELQDRERYTGDCAGRKSVKLIAPFRALGKLYQKVQAAINAIFSVVPSVGLTRKFLIANRYLDVEYEKSLLQEKVDNLAEPIDFTNMEEIDLDDPTIEIPSASFDDAELVNAANMLGTDNLYSIFIDGFIDGNLNMTDEQKRVAHDQIKNYKGNLAQMAVDLKRGKSIADIMNEKAQLDAGNPNMQLTTPEKANNIFNCLSNDQFKDQAQQFLSNFPQADQDELMRLAEVHKNGGEITPADMEYLAKLGMVDLIQAIAESMQDDLVDAPITMEENEDLLNSLDDLTQSETTTEVVEETPEFEGVADEDIGSLSDLVEDEPEVEGLGDATVPDGFEGIEPTPAPEPVRTHLPFGFKDWVLESYGVYEQDFVKTMKEAGKEWVEEAIKYYKEKVMTAEQAQKLEEEISPPF